MPAEASPARVFFALWPGPAVRHALAQRAVQARAECGGRAIPAEKIHLTLVFVGAVERARIDALLSCAAELERTPFELDLSRLGYWRQSRIVWAGAATCPPALRALVAVLSHKLEGLGLRFDARPYVPHVTLVRDARKAPQSVSAQPLSWHCKELVLVESVAAARASRYDILARWPLGCN